MSVCATKNLNALRERKSIRIKNIELQTRPIVPFEFKVPTYVPIYKNQTYFTPKQEPKCRKADPLDYLIYISAHIGDKLLENALKTEEEKPYNQRNNVAIILGELGRFGFSFVKYEVNKDLCNPI